jgi:D-alanyl-D-alanine dipeptidase
MGSIFDDASEISHLDYLENNISPHLALTEGEARRNRRLLYWVMAEIGFAANPSEWWHYSYGDQMWARLAGTSSAKYGIADAPEHDNDSLPADVASV